MTDAQATEELESYLKPESITGISYDCARHSLQAIRLLRTIEKAWALCPRSDPEKFINAMITYVQVWDIGPLRRLAGEDND
jgi:hypothetical protein